MAERNVVSAATADAQYADNSPGPLMAKLSFRINTILDMFKWPDYLCITKERRRHDNAVVANLSRVRLVSYRLFVILHC